MVISSLPLSGGKTSGEDQILLFCTIKGSLKHRNPEENKPKRWKLPRPVAPQESQARARVLGVRGQAATSSANAHPACDLPCRGGRESGDGWGRWSAADSKPSLSCTLLRGRPRHQAALQLLPCLPVQPGRSSRRCGQCQLLPAPLPVLPEWCCPGLLGSLPNPPGLAIQLLSPLCK